MNTTRETCPQCDIKLDKSFKFCPNCGVYLTDHQLNERIRQVLEKQSQGNSWQGMQQLKELAHDFPDNAMVHKLLGNVYFHMGLLGWATDCYQAALRVDPGYIDAHYDLGVALYHRARVNDAIQEFLTVLKLDPDYHAAHYRIGLCYRHVGKLNVAVHHLLESTVITPDYVMAHYHLGEIYFQEEEFEKALNSFQRLLKEHPQHEASARYLQLISEKEGNPAAT
jgi:tetratricopeptide (TPR) repeat protein